MANVTSGVELVSLDVDSVEDAGGDGWEVDAVNAVALFEYPVWAVVSVSIVFGVLVILRTVELAFLGWSVEVIFEVLCVVAVSIVVSMVVGVFVAAAVVAAVDGAVGFVTEVVWAVVIVDPFSVGVVIAVICDVAVLVVNVCSLRVVDRVAVVSGVDASVFGSFDVGNVVIIVVGAEVGLKVVPTVGDDGSQLYPGCAPRIGQHVSQQTWPWLLQSLTVDNVWHPVATSPSGQVGPSQGVASKAGQVMQHIVFMCTCSRHSSLVIVAQVVPSGRRSSWLSPNGHCSVNNSVETMLCLHAYTTLLVTRILGYFKTIIYMF